MTIVERALEFVVAGSCIGLGSGRAALSFVRALGERQNDIRGVPTSEQTAAVAREVGIPLISLADAGMLALTVDGADEVDPQLNLIKGYGRALVREKVVAASSQRLIILVGEEKLVRQVGSRGKLPVEVLPFAVPLCERRLRALDCEPILWADAGRPMLTDNGNHILDCRVEPIADPCRLENDIRAIPGVVGTGLFLGMSDVVLVGRGADNMLIQEFRPPQ